MLFEFPRLSGYIAIGHFAGTVQLNHDAGKNVQENDLCKSSLNNKLHPYNRFVKNFLAPIYAIISHKLLI